MRPLVVTKIKKGGFIHYMKSIGKLGGQNKVPRLANNRDIADNLSVFLMENKKKHIAILGSTGSIGTQALEVISEQSRFFELEVLTANSNSDLLIKQALQHKPNAVVIADKEKFQEVNDALFSHNIKVYAGADAIAQVVEMEQSIWF